MAFRNDLDALLARAEALERENRELRGKLAEDDDTDELKQQIDELRAEVAVQKAEGRKQSKKQAAKKAREAARKLKDKNRKLRGKLGQQPLLKRAMPALKGLLFVGACALAYLLNPIDCAGCKQDTTHGKPDVKSVFIVQSEAGDAVLSVVYTEQVEKKKGKVRTRRDYTRVTAFNLPDGSKRGTLTLLEHPRHKSSSYGLYRPVGNRVWGNHPKDGLQLVDLSTPAILYTQADLVAKLPALEAGFRTGTVSVSKHAPPTASMMVILSDGTKNWIDMPPALLAKPPPTEPRPYHFCDSNWSRSCARAECLGFVSVSGTTAVKLAISGTYRDRSPLTVVGPKATAMLRPRLVEHIQKTCAFELDGQRLVLHDSAAVGAKTTLLSLLDAGGKVVWTRPFEELTTHAKAKIMGAFAHGDGIFLLLSQSGASLTLIKLSRQGKLLAHHELF